MLATIERIDAVRTHPNADRLDIIRVLGYECIVGRGNHQEGESVLLIQPDVILPADRPWCAELLKYTSKGRVKAARLRGEWSMGIVVPLSDLEGAIDPPQLVALGDDIGEALGIVKFEPPLPKDLKAKGGLPFGIPKTDEERWQNLVGHARRLAVRDGRSTPEDHDLDQVLTREALHLGEVVDVTLKIDGSSFTAFCALPEHFPIEAPALGICSRSLELKMEEGFSNPWVDAARATGVLDRLEEYCLFHGVSLALRGEVYGPGVQTLSVNPHCRMPRGVAFFSVWNIAEHRYEGANSLHYYRRVCDSLQLPTVPLLHEAVYLTQELIDQYDHELEEVNGQPFEGVVIKGADFSFKVVNKFYDARK